MHGKKRHTYRSLLARWQDVNARECLEDIGIDGRRKLKWIKMG
jgi:hypothetical protein